MSSDNLHMEDHPSNDQIFMTRLTEIIHSNLANDRFGVNELASQAGMSHYQLSKKVHTITGKTVVQYMRDIRLRKALEMLKNRELTVAEIAYKNGFGSATYFTATFTEYYGYSPIKVKKGEIDIPENTAIDYYPVKPNKKQPGRVAVFSISGAIVLIMLLFWLIPVKSEKENTASVFISAPYKQSIAVLPFRNLSDSTGNLHFADGIAEDIMTQLSLEKDLKVVEGSIQKSGNTFRLWIQLIDGRDNTHLLSEVFNGRYSGDMFEFQSNTGRSVTEKVKAVIMKNARTD
ncbi:MAG: helix-turn-helix domain-containing protein [Bacteroidia bacterium]|nr:helix-turn-helix domain-containing protein [Bacteroidia bacterium]